MASIKEIRAANQVFGTKGIAELVAVFVGGTSGIGEYSIKKFAKYAKEPRLYFVGRNEKAAARIKEELAQLNPSAKATFIKADVSSLAAVDAVTAQLKKLEKKINILHMGQGVISFKGREENSEGLVPTAVLYHYGRMRFALNLLPLLKIAATEDKDSIGARVMSILASGREGHIFDDDLELKENFSFRTAYGHIVAISSFAIEALALQHPEIAWMHVYPGFVQTNITRELPWVMRILSTVTSSWKSESKDNCGEAMVQLMVAGKFETGCHLVGLYGEDRDTRRKNVGDKPWWSETRRELVWKHTEEMMARVPRKEGS